MSLLTRWRLRRSPNAAQAVRQARGARGERLARERLQREGFVIEAANVRFPIGEIDLIAREGQTLCFVEVRSSSSPAFGGALASITDRKRRHLIRAAEWYLARRSTQPEAVRFDVVAVQWRQEGAPSIELVRGAFDAS